MRTMTQADANRIHEHTATLVANLRAQADAAEAAGNETGAASLRRLADSRERATLRARAGARIGQA